MINKYEKEINLQETCELIKMLKRKCIRLQEYEDAAALRNMELKYKENLEIEKKGND